MYNQSAQAQPIAVEYEESDRGAADNARNRRRSAIGAMLGAVLGALIWFLVEYSLRLQIGCAALLVGVLAGWGAIVAGQRKGPDVGAMAAVAGILGILVGSFAFFQANKEELLPPMVPSDLPSAAVLPAATLDISTDRGPHALSAEVGYIDYLTRDSRSLLYMLLFGGLGLSYSYWVGCGGGDEDYDD
ncbi:MAG: hypothetical protein MJE77_22815 [Proteobacteria bacterium]|nr:hypothetical protein [Pseudomonadota bacterium]